MRVKVTAPSKSGKVAYQSQEPFVTKVVWLHHLTKAGPKQLCALARLGCTRTAGTSSNEYTYVVRNSILHPSHNISTEMVKLLSALN